MMNVHFQELVRLDPLILVVDPLILVGASIIIATLLFIYSQGKRWKEGESQGPLPAKHDQLWKNIRQSCTEMSLREPLLRIRLKNVVVSQPSFESAICLVLAEKLATPSIPAAEWSSFLSDVLVRPGKPPKDLELLRTAIKSERKMTPTQSMIWGEGEPQMVPSLGGSSSNHLPADPKEAQIGGKTTKKLLINSCRPSYATFSRAECAALCKAFQDTMKNGETTARKLQPYGRAMPSTPSRSSSIVKDMINGEWDPATDKSAHKPSVTSTSSASEGGDWQLEHRAQRNASPNDLCPTTQVAGGGGCGGDDTCGTSSSKTRSLSFGTERDSYRREALSTTATTKADQKSKRKKASVEEDGAWRWPPKEGKWPLTALLRADLRATVERDPASRRDPAHPFLFFKGYHGLAAHRIAHVLWHRGRKDAAHLIQSRCSEVFGMDIHPAATIGRGCMFDHATGIVVGESTVIGDDCSFLHGVTLGGTGKQIGDRHPKLGDGVLVGANASILGNIRVGSRTKIGCGSVVLRAIPNGATAVGIPAKVIGRSSEENPGDSNDHSLRNVQFLDHSTEEFDFCSIWQRLDTRKEGFLTPQEFHERATTIGKLSPERADEIFFELDKDNDGIVSEKEFFQSIQNVASLAGWDSVKDLAKL